MSRSAPAVAVVGAGYGDEGKGLLVDALCHVLGSGAVVVRHNGGAQAAHTVVTPDGRRHVFHHVGAGSFASAATALSRHFVSNPLVFAEERAALAALGLHPRVSADERGLVTTPWDMMVNQIMEEARGGARHGSCGLGFGETIERCADPRYATVLRDLRGDPAALRRRFDRIRRDWMPARLTRLGRPDLWLRHRDLALSPGGLDRALRSALDMPAHLDLVPHLAVAPDAPVVFEGAQGLMLDQRRGAFPHVTRSNTGLADVVDVARDLGIGTVEVVYATRAYVTRHGAGPLAHEQDAPPGPAFRDPTNRPNAWQGRLRFGLLDLDVLAAAVRADLADAARIVAEAGGPALAPRFAVTCLDQMPAEVAWVEGGAARRGTKDALVRRVGAILPDAPAPMTSRGPTRATLDGLMACAVGR